jgi:hypothetical protein
MQPETDADSSSPCAAVSPNDSLRNDVRTASKPECRQQRGPRVELLRALQAPAHFGDPARLRGHARGDEPELPVVSIACYGAADPPGRRRRIPELLLDERDLQVRRCRARLKVSSRRARRRARLLRRRRARTCLARLNLPQRSSSTWRARRARKVRRPSASAWHDGSRCPESSTERSRTWRDPLQAHCVPSRPRPIVLGMLLVAITVATLTVVLRRPRSPRRS